MLEDTYRFAQSRINTALRRLQRRLYLRRKNLSVLPRSIAQLTALRLLDLSANKLSSLPPEIGQLTALQTLDLSANHLASLPREIGQLAALKSLDLSENRLSALPPEIGQLATLQSLNLSGNQFRLLPPEIGKLAGLQSLDLRGNPLETLPSELQELRKLRHLKLSAAPTIASQPPLASRADGALMNILRGLTAVFVQMFARFPLGWKVLTTVISILAVVAIIGIIYDAVFLSRVEIEAIAVPEALVKAGYTPEGVARRLRDAMDKYAVDVGIRYIGESALISSETVTISSALKYSLHSEQPEFVVPTIGLSTETIAGIIRKTRLFRWFIPAHQTISGEITNIDSKFQLRLWNDGELFYTSESVDSRRPDDLFEPGPETLLATTNRYFAAATTLRTNPQRSLQMVESEIKKLRLSDPHYSDWLYLKGLILQSQYNLDGAIELYEGLVKKRSDDYTARLHLGLAYLLKGSYQAAACQFWAGINLPGTDPADTTSGDLYIGLARALARGANTAECDPRVDAVTSDEATERALYAYWRATTVNPIKASSFFKLANALQDHKRYKEAEKQYNKAIDFYHGYARAYFNLGDMLHGQGRIEEAKAAYSGAVKSDQKDAEAHLRLGSVLHDLSRKNGNTQDGAELWKAGNDEYQLAEGLYDSVIEAGSKDEISYIRNYSYFNRGSLRASQGKYGSAIDDYSNLIESSTKNPRATYSRVLGFRGYAYFDLGDFQKAQDDFTTALKESHDVYFMLWLFLSQNRVKSESGASDRLQKSRDILREKSKQVITGKENSWPNQIVKMYLGELSIDDTYDAAKNEMGSFCEAKFYVGEWYLLNNDRDGAETPLSAASESCPELFHESAGAKAELERIKTTGAFHNASPAQ